MTLCKSCIYSWPCAVWQGVFHNGFCPVWFSPAQHGNADTTIATSIMVLQTKLQETHPVQEQQVQEAVKQAVASPFVMASGPMIHCTLIPICPPLHTRDQCKAWSMCWSSTCTTPWLMAGPWGCSSETSAEPTTRSS